MATIKVYLNNGLPALVPDPAANLLPTEIDYSKVGAFWSGDYVQFRTDIDRGFTFGGAKFYWGDVQDVNGNPAGASLQDVKDYLSTIFFLNNGGGTCNELGELFNDNFARASLGANWAVFGASSFATDGTKLVLSGGTGLHTDYIQYQPYTTCLELWTAKVSFKAVTVTPTSYGVGMGIQSISPYDSRYIEVQFGYPSGVGIIYIAAANLTPTVNSGATDTLAVSANDDLQMTVVRQYNTLTVLVENITTGQFLTFAYNFSLTYTGGSIVSQHNTGKFVLHNFGGTINITEYNVSSVQFKNQEYLFVGDSITYGLFADATCNRFANIIGSKLGIVNSNSGGSDITASVLARISEIIALAPQSVVLMIGGNDVFFGVAQATYEANYISIRNQLVAAGIGVIHLYATPRDATNMTALNTFIATNPNFASDVKIDTFTPLKDGATGLAAAYDSGDGIHPNRAGHAKIANTALTAHNF